MNHNLIQIQNNDMNKCIKPKTNCSDNKTSLLFSNTQKKIKENIMVYGNLQLEVY